MQFFTANILKRDDSLNLIPKLYPEILAVTSGHVGVSLCHHHNHPCLSLHRQLLQRLPLVVPRRPKPHPQPRLHPQSKSHHRHPNRNTHTTQNHPRISGRRICRVWVGETLECQSLASSSTKPSLCVFAVPSLLHLPKHNKHLTVSKNPNPEIHRPDMGISSRRSNSRVNDWIIHLLSPTDQVSESTISYFHRIPRLDPLILTVFKIGSSRCVYRLTMSQHQSLQSHPVINFDCVAKNKGQLKPSKQ